MIGLLLHGPRVFDSGWARRIADAVRKLGPVRIVSAGTMARTALLDSGLEDVECPGEGPSTCLKTLENRVESILLATFGKSEYSGLTFGGMVAERSRLRVPLVQVECSVPCFVEWRAGCGLPLIRVLEGLGCAKRPPPVVQSLIWEEKGAVHRRMATVVPGDFLLIDGILVGRAAERDVVFICEGRRITGIRGAEIKAHGLEKIERLDGVDLRTAKLASTADLRSSGAAARVQAYPGTGMAFIDHAGMQVYDLIRGAQGAVSVGDDTTAVVGDVLYRFAMPVIGIVDGDGDGVLGRPRIARGSCVLRVDSDDLLGGRIREAVFKGNRRIDVPFSKVRDLIVGLAGPRLISRQDF